MATTKWPKVLPPLDEERKRISDDFMKYWHEVLPRKYGIIDRFNHSYCVRRAPRDFRRTLEIGAGIGEHLDYENLTPEQERELAAARELRPARGAQNPRPIDTHYEAIRLGLRAIFDELGLAA